MAYSLGIASKTPLWSYLSCAGSLCPRGQVPTGIFGAFTECFVISELLQSLNKSSSHTSGPSNGDVHYQILGVHVFSPISLSGVHMYLSILTPNH